MPTFLLSNDIGPKAYVYQSLKPKEDLLAARPFESIDTDGDDAAISLDNYVLSIDKEVLKAVAILITTDTKPDFNETTAQKFLDSDSEDKFSSDIGFAGYVYQSRLTAEELLSLQPFTIDGHDLSLNRFVISTEGTVLVTAVVLIETDDIPAYNTMDSDEFLSDYAPREINVSNDIGPDDCVFQSHLAADQLIGKTNLNIYDEDGDEVTHSNLYLRTSEGKLLKAKLVFYPTDETPDFDKEQATAYLAETAATPQDEAATADTSDSTDGD